MMWPESLTAFVNDVIKWSPLRWWKDGERDGQKEEAFNGWKEAINAGEKVRASFWRQARKGEWWASPGLIYAVTGGRSWSSLDSVISSGILWSPPFIFPLTLQSSSGLKIFQVDIYCFLCIKLRYLQRMHAKVKLFYQQLFLYNPEPMYWLVCT